MADTLQGRCFCGEVQFEFETPIVACVNCHCESCRRQCSAPMATYIGVTDSQWRWTGAMPETWCSSPGVERTFCGNCGSPLSFRSEKLSDTMHFYLVALEQPEAFQPTLHVAYEEKLCWMPADNSLPKHHGPDYLNKDG